MQTYYREIAESLIPHLLGFYDIDPYSPTSGYGDRYFWGWKLKDFNNGLMQGGAYALALFRSLESFPDSDKALDVIKRIFRAVGRMQHRNGSVDEAFPYEYAYSVTSTLAFDLLFTLDLIDNDLNSEEYEEFLGIITRLIEFISSNKETHGFISNHLATAVAAIEKYNQKTGQKIDASKRILRTIIEKQSPEGWYLEYEGPDPGYQTLCIYYLARVYEIIKEESLLQSLEKSVAFLSYFLHPDSSMGGEYGSRNTELFYPGGIELLSSELPVAQSISNWMYSAVREERTVTLKSIDTGNFIPLVENYLVAYQASQRRPHDTCNPPPLPCERENVDIFFCNANVLVRGNSKYYAIVSGAKGGVTKVFDKQKKCIVWDDCGYIGKLKKGKLISTQAYKQNPSCVYEEGTLRIETSFYEVLNMIPSPSKFTLLRMLNLTLMRNKQIGNMAKNWIIKLLITRKQEFPTKLLREVAFSEYSVTVKDQLSKSRALQFKWLEYGKKFSTIHMASSKYFQNQFWTRAIEAHTIDLARFNIENRTAIETRIVFGEEKIGDPTA